MPTLSARSVSTATGPGNDRPTKPQTQSVATPSKAPRYRPFTRFYERHPATIGELGYERMSIASKE